MFFIGDCDPSKTKLIFYGAQLYVWPSNLGSIDPDESEIDFGIVPDK